MRDSRGFGRRQLLASAALGALAGLGCSKLSCSRPAARANEASFWYSYGGHSREVLEELIRRFNASQTEHRVQGVFQGDYYECLAKLRIALAAGEPPTLSHVIGEVIPYLAEAGALDSFERFTDATELDLIEPLAQAGTWEGGRARPLVALPFNRSTPIAILNGTLFDAERLGPPRSWDELRQVALRLSRRAASPGHGFECPVTWWFWVALLGQAGGTLTDASGRLVLGGRAGEQALALWQELVHEHRVMKVPTGGDAQAWETTNADFIAERVAMIWTSTAFLKHLERHAPFSVRAAPLPAEERFSVPTGGTFFVMPRGGSTPRQAEAAWAFLRWMLAPDQNVHWARETGYLPTTWAAVHELERRGHFERQPNARVALKQLEVASPWPWSKELFRVQREVVQPLLEGAVLSRRDAGHTLAEARASAARTL